MKRLAIAVIVVGVIFIGGYYIANVPSTTEYVAPQEVVVEKEVQVDALDKAIKDAQEAEKANIEAIAKKSYDDTYTQEMKKVELQVIGDFNKKLEARQEVLEGELSL